MNKRIADLEFKIFVLRHIQKAHSTDIFSLADKNSTDTIKRLIDFFQTELESEFSEMELNAPEDAGTQ